MPKTNKSVKSAKSATPVIDPKAEALRRLQEATEAAKALGVIPERKKREASNRGYDGRAYVVASLHFAVYGDAPRRDEIRKPLRPDALVPDLANALPRLRDRGVLRQESRGAGGHVFTPLGIEEKGWNPTDTDVTEGIACFTKAHPDVKIEGYTWNPVSGFFDAAPIPEAPRAKAPKTKGKVAK